MTRALITRPLEDATPLAEALRALGIEPVIEPLLTITLRPEALPPLDGVHALLVTSANGVRAFVAASGRRDLPVFAVGPSTAAVARNAGFATVETADGNVTALAALVAARAQPADGTLLHVAGSEVAGDLAGDLTARGYTVARAVLYDAAPADTLTADVLADLGAGRIDWVLLFSPRTATTFARLIDAAGRVEALTRATAICLSAAVADAVAGLPWQRVRVATQPDQASLLDLLESLKAEAAPAPARQPTRPTATAAARAARRGGGILPAVAAAVTTVVVLIAALAVSAPLWIDLVLPAPTPAPASSLPGPGQSIAQVEDQMNQRIATLSDQLEALRSRLTTLAGTAPATTNQSGVNELGQRTGELADQIKALQERVGAAEQTREHEATTRARAAAFAVGVAELDSMARAGRPFAASLKALRALAPESADTELLQPLEPYAAKGVATLEQLRRDWPAVARAAQAAQVAADYGEAYGGWVGRIMKVLSGAFTIRRVGGDVPGGDTEALLARAGARLDADDLAGALSTLATLSEPAADAAKPWLERARARRAVETALTQLTERALHTIVHAGG
ncbi:MAG TPA: uroporphyrinogen-III synthase [Candidatus Sulfotelmatobacter sp.]|nr:uroporphyrinogen-III synthase [Candidatus Sulfotelmatobacter sp.]